MVINEKNKDNKIATKFILAKFKFPEVNIFVIPKERQHLKWVLRVKM